MNNIRADIVMDRVAMKDNVASLPNAVEQLMKKYNNVVSNLSARHLITFVVSNNLCHYTRTISNVFILCRLLSGPCVYPAWHECWVFESKQQNCI